MFIASRQHASSNLNHTHHGDRGVSSIFFPFLFSWLFDPITSGHANVRRNAKFRAIRLNCLTTFPGRMS